MAIQRDFRASFAHLQELGPNATEDQLAKHSVKADRLRI